MLRRLSLHEHGAIELLTGLALVAAPFVLGFGPVALVASLTAGALLAGLGLSDGMSISAHMAADTALAAALVGRRRRAGGRRRRARGGRARRRRGGASSRSRRGTRWTRRSRV